ncbi:TIGR04388 family protein [Leptospira andrefontaineae]|uniref:TIGR04388 family protein n=1 Tax=Leptospira andrefontaineae TaxID=2484976 RepID=A0A4R9HAM7_9LEPT|nr:TIGR04388 family protein [Leptospira andrefontaineae]TGK43545.1 TIGR04388 family protein [Leptospira andrefontaineae]
MRKSIQSYKYILIILFLPLGFDRTFPDPVSVPTLNAPNFSSSSMDQTFVLADRMQSVGNWDAFVFQSLGVLQSQWEIQLQMQISQIVNSIDTSDHYASVADYQSYVYDTLQSQANELLLQWQQDAELEITQERSQYLSDVFGANSASTQAAMDSFSNQWDQFINGQNLNLNLNDPNQQAILNGAQQNLENMEAQWWNQFNYNIQNGLWTYQQALQNLTQSYQNVLNQINETERQYQAYLAMLEQTEANVKDQIQAGLDGYQAYLNGNDLFWNSINVLYDNNTNSYLIASCASGHVCNTYEYDKSSGQFFNQGSCPLGQSCVSILYDTTDKKYLEVSCPSGHTCDGEEKENISIRTGLNADGKAFQSAINNVMNALQAGYDMPAIFDSTSGTMLHYNLACLNGDTCVKGYFDSSTGSFTTGTCTTSTCHSAVVNTSGNSLTGTYLATTCPAGDTSCVVCTSGHSCKVQSMDATLLYASGQMMNFLNNELSSTQAALSNMINGVTGPETIHVGESEYSFKCLSSGFCGYLPVPTSSSSLSLSMGEYLNPTDVSGLAGLAKMIADYIDHQITQTDLINWIMAAYSDNLLNGTDDGGFFSLLGLSPGTTITGIVNADLMAYNDENYTFDLWEADYSHPYCKYWGGCAALWGTNESYSQTGGAFVDFQMDTVLWWGLFPAGILPASQLHDSIWVNLSVTTQDNNSVANVTTYEDLVTQLQGFQYNWAQNVLPSIINWTAQVATYEGQYDAWQIERAEAIAEAQETYNQGVTDLQDQESDWMAAMLSLQEQAEKAFDAAANSLRDAKGQSNYDSLYQEILGKLDFNKGIPNANATASADLSSYTDILSGLKGNISQANTRIPDTSLLSNFAENFNNLITGSSNLTLLSATNNSVVNSSMSFMQGIADSMKKELTFRQNAFGKLLQDKNIDIVEEGNESYVLQNGQKIAVLNEDGTQKKDEDGKTIYKTLSDWLKDTCGDDLSNAACSSYVEKKYSDVVLNSDGTISAKMKAYTGGAYLREGGDGTNYDDYVYDSVNKSITIHAPKKTLLGRGLSSLGNIFDAGNNGIGEYVSQSFANLNNYFSDSKSSAFLFSEVTALGANNSYYSNIASREISHQIKTLNFVLDYIKVVFLGGATNVEWFHSQLQQGVQDIYASILVKTLDLDPQTAAFISGMQYTQYSAHQAEKEMNRQYGGLGWGIHQAEGILDDMGFGGLTSFYPPIMYDQIKNADNLRAIDAWENFKYNIASFAIMKYGQEHGWSDEHIGLATQLVTDYMKMKDAKDAFGMNGSAFSLKSIAGQLKALTVAITSPMAEVMGAIYKGYAHAAGDLGLISEREEKEFNKDLRYTINQFKYKDEKEALRQWKTDQPLIASEMVREIGRQQGWDEATINTWSEQAANYIIRKQAENDLEKRNLLRYATLGPAAWVDDQAFGGGLTTLSAKFLRGMVTTFTDIYSSLGIIGEDLRDDIYKQSKFAMNKFTGADLKASMHYGEVNEAMVMEDVRKQIFANIGDFLAPNFPGLDGETIGLLLKHYVDEREAKKAAKEQKLKDAQLVVQVAAAAAMTYFSAGAAGAQASSWLSSVLIQTGTTAAGVAQGITGGQLIAGITSAVAQAYIGGKLDGTNGAISGFVNGLISLATVGFNTPVTGYVSWTEHKNANILTGQREVKGGWGGGISYNAADLDISVLKNLSSASGGLSFAPGSGLGVNFNLGFEGDLGLGLDYNLSTGNYTASGSYSHKLPGGNNLSYSISASKTGQASLGVGYSYGGDKLPSILKGPGANLSFSNDGIFSLSASVLGGTIGSVNYDSNTGSFGKFAGNHNFQNQFNQSIASQNAQDNANETGRKIAELEGRALVAKGKLSEAELQNLLEKDPNALRAKFDEYFHSSNEAQQKELTAAMKQVADEMIKEKKLASFETTKDSPEGVEGFLKRLAGGIKQSFGISDDGIASIDSKGNFRFSTCFVAGTEITKLRKEYKGFVNSLERHPEWEETVPIEQIHAGDVVLAKNDETGELGYKRVLQSIIKETDSVHWISFSDDSNLGTTKEHPFRRQKTEYKGQNFNITNSEWVDAKDLNIGDIVFTADGNTLEVSDLQIEKQITTVYNFEVEDFHSYFVGDSGIWVHNHEGCFPNKPGMGIYGPITKSHFLLDSISKNSGNPNTNSLKEFSIDKVIGDTSLPTPTFTPPNYARAKKDMDDAVKEGDQLRRRRDALQAAKDNFGKDKPKNMTPEQRDVTSRIEKTFGDEIEKINKLLEENTNKKISALGNMKKSNDDNQRKSNPDQGKPNPDGFDPTTSALDFAFKTGKDPVGYAQRAQEIAKHEQLIKKDERGAQSAKQDEGIREKIENFLKGEEVGQAKPSSGDAEPTGFSQVFDYLKQLGKQETSNKEHYQKRIGEFKQQDDQIFGLYGNYPIGKQLAEKVEYEGNNLAPEERKQILKSNESLNAEKESEIRKLDEERKKHLQENPQASHALPEWFKKKIKEIYSKSKLLHDYVNLRRKGIPEGVIKRYFYLLLKADRNPAEVKELREIVASIANTANEIAPGYKDVRTMKRADNNYRNTPRKEVAKQIKDKRKKLDSLEEELSKVNPVNEGEKYSQLQDQADQLREEIYADYQDFFTHKPSLESEKPPTEEDLKSLAERAVKVNDSYESEPPLLKQMKEDLEKDKRKYNKSGNKAKEAEVDELLRQCKNRSQTSEEYTIKSQLIEDLRPGEEKGGQKYQDALKLYKEYFTPFGKKEFKITENSKNHLGDNINSNSTSNSSRFGDEGRSFELVPEAKNFFDYLIFSAASHVGNDYLASKGQQTNSSYPGQVLGIVDTGHSITLNKQVPKLLADQGVVYKDVEYDKTGNRIQNPGYYNKDTGESYSSDKLEKMYQDERSKDPKSKEPEKFSPAPKAVGVLAVKGKDNVYRFKLAGGGFLTSDQLLELPDSVRSNPEKFTKQGGNSVSILSQITEGDFIGSYEVRYLHLDKAPMKADGTPLKKDDPVKAGDKIGVAGSTGFSKGNHLHTTVIFQGSGRPNIDRAFYQPMRDDSGNVTGYAIHSDYFRNKMATDPKTKFKHEPQQIKKYPSH